MGMHVHGMIYAQGSPLVPLFPTPGQAYYLDPVNGSDSNDGKSADAAFLTLATAYAALTANQHDILFLLSGASGLTLTETLTWAKDYTHLIGVSSDLPGMGQRARITGGATTDLTEVMTISADGCKFINLQIANWADADADSGAVTVSGDRNFFYNVFFAGMGHATPAARAGSYTLKVTGSENHFERCTFGLDTIVRAAANAEVHVSAERNRFWFCNFRSYSETAGKFLVKIDNSGGDLRDTEFWDCYFFNYSVNWAGGIDNAFDMPAGGNTHWVALRGNNFLMGLNNAASATMGWADTVTHMYGAGPTPNAGFGVSVNPTT